LLGRNFVWDYFSLRELTVKPKTLSGLRPATGATPVAMTTDYVFFQNENFGTFDNPVIEAAAGRPSGRRQLSNEILSMNTNFGFQLIG
jgi:hypothetical protein